MGRDSVYGGGGDDLVTVGNGGADTVSGGDGFDTLEIDSSDSAYDISVDTTGLPWGGASGVPHFDFGDGSKITGFELYAISTGSGRDWVALGAETGSSIWMAARGWIKRRSAFWESPPTSPAAASRPAKSRGSMFLP